MANCLNKWVWSEMLMITCEIVEGLCSRNLLYWMQFSPSVLMALTSNTLPTLQIPLNMARACHDRGLWWSILDQFDLKRSLNKCPTAAPVKPDEGTGAVMKSCVFLVVLAVNYSLYRDTLNIFQHANLWWWTVRIFLYFLVSRTY